ncbi:MAG: universal stress protein [Reyranella sp.]
MSDLEGIESAPIGAMGYAQDRRRHRAKVAYERRARVAELPRSFEQSCAAASVEVRCQTIDGDIRAELIHAIETSDMMVTGLDTEFHLEPSDDVSPLVEHIVARGCRPVLVTGPEAPEDGPVVVAYDGSVPAAKALQLAVLLGIFGSSPARVVSVYPGDQAFEAATRARDYLVLHGITADIEAVTSTDHPADVLRAHASAVHARLLVMGAFGHRGLQEILFGSSTRRLLHGLTVPLFIYH